MYNKKGIWPLAGIIVFTVLILGAVGLGIWYGGREARIVQTPVGGQPLKGVKLAEDTTFELHTDQRYSASTQPACLSSLYVNGGRLADDINEGGTETLNPGDAVEVYYCSNQSDTTTIDAASEGWYGMVEKGTISLDAGKFDAIGEPCRWTSDVNNTITVTNQDGTTNPGTTLAIGSGETRYAEVEISQAGTYCYSNPDGFLSVVINANMTSLGYEYVELRNVQWFKDNKVTTIDLIDSGDNGAVVPKFHTVRTTGDSALAFKIPGGLEDGDRLKFQVWMKAVDGQNPANTRVHLNATIYDSDYFAHTRLGTTTAGIDGPAPQNNLGVNLGISGDDTFGIGIT